MDSKYEPESQYKKGGGAFAPPGVFVRSEKSEAGCCARDINHFWQLGVIQLPLNLLNPLLHKGGSKVRGRRIQKDLKIFWTEYSPRWLSKTFEIGSDQLRREMFNQTEHLFLSLVEPAGGWLWGGRLKVWKRVRAMELSGLFWWLRAGGAAGAIEPDCLFKHQIMICQR